MQTIVRLKSLREAQEGGREEARHGLLTQCAGQAQQRLMLKPIRRDTRMQ
jgi:hypothetical protein